MSADDSACAELVRRLYEGECEPGEFAEAMGLSLMEVGELASRDDVARALHGLRVLGDLRAQMMLSRYRLTAAATLLGLAHESDSAEVSRKACVDLLKLEVSGGAGGAGVATGRPGVDLDEERVMAALREIGGGDGVDGGTGGGV